jgi:hypothetical protein
MDEEMGGADMPIEIGEDSEEIGDAHIIDVEHFILEAVVTRGVKQEPRDSMVEEEQARKEEEEEQARKDAAEEQARKEVEEQTLLEDESIVLGDGETVAMAVKESPLLWRTFAADRVTLSEGGAVATQSMDEEHLDEGDLSLTTTGIELTEGKHYWEVELLSKMMDMTYIGISRPKLDPSGHYPGGTSPYAYDDGDDAWFMCAVTGGLSGNGKYYEDDAAGPYEQGDRVGVLLDLDDGSLRFFKNGEQHGPGYPAGSVTGPVVHAVQMCYESTSVRLLPDAEAPAPIVN